MNKILAKKIGIVMQNDYPNPVEIRAKKFIMTFQNFFDKKPIVMCAATFGKAEHEQTSSEIIYRFIQSPSPINFLWTFFIIDVAKKEEVELLICSNIRIALPSIVAAKILKIPVILDLQENNSEVVTCRPKSKWMHVFTRNKRLVYLLELICAHLADVVWTVTEEMKHCVEKMGVDSKKIVVIYNVPKLEASFHLQKNAMSDVFTLIYVGILEDMRGIDVIIRALYLVIAKDQNVHFNIIGYGDSRVMLEKLVEELDLGPYIHFLGRIQPDIVHNYLCFADIGLIPHRVNSFTNTTMPNKLFDYMASGLPVLCTDMVPVRRIVLQEQCGVIIPEKSSIENISQMILTLKSSVSNRKLMGEQGKRAVELKYNWKIESKKVVESIDTLLG